MGHRSQHKQNGFVAASRNTFGNFRSFVNGNCTLKNVKMLETGTEKTVCQLLQRIYSRGCTIGPHRSVHYHHHMPLKTAVAVTVIYASCCCNLSIPSSANQCLKFDIRLLAVLGQPASQVCIYICQTVEGDIPVLLLHPRLDQSFAFLKPGL